MKKKIKRHSPSTHVTTFSPDKKPQTREIPSRYYRLGAMVNQRDSEFFLKNPHVTMYTRPYVPGECWPHNPKATFTKVLRFGCQRIRIPLDELGNPIGDEESEAA